MIREPRGLVSLGTSLKYVRIWRGWWISVQRLHECRSINQRPVRTGGRGSRNPKILHMSFMDGPFLKSPFRLRAGGARFDFVLRNRPRFVRSFGRGRSLAELNAVLNGPFPRYTCLVSVAERESRGHWPLLHLLGAALNCLYLNPFAQEMNR